MSRNARGVAFENQTKYLLLSWRHFEGKKFLVSFPKSERVVKKSLFSCGEYIPNVCLWKNPEEKGILLLIARGKKRGYKGTPEISEERLGGRRVRAMAFKLWPQLTGTNTQHQTNIFWKIAYPYFVRLMSFHQTHHHQSTDKTTCINSLNSSSW